MSGFRFRIWANSPEFVSHVRFCRGRSVKPLSREELRAFWAECCLTNTKPEKLNYRLEIEWTD